MNCLRSVVLLLLLPITLFAATPIDSAPCAHWPAWLKPLCRRPYQTWTEGQNELYLTGYAWHNRYYYDADRLSRYNENAWGGGLGKSFFDENGNWHGLFTFAFLDSHRYLEPLVGYAFLKAVHFTEKAWVGAGYTALITQRPDIFNGIPFPGALPWVSAGYQKASLAAIYIPGSRNVGNVLFLVAKWVF